MRLFLLFFLSSALWPDLANAYVGPGLGVGAISAVLGVIGAILLSVFALVYYPVKRALRKRREARQAKQMAMAGDKAAAADE